VGTVVWSQPLLIFNPETDGYCKVMHRRLPSDCAGIGPNPGDLGQRDSNDPNLLADGGEYAPELLPARYFKVDGEVMTIYYVMSTWNPYHAILVRTRVTTSRFARLVAFLGSLRTLIRTLPFRRRKGMYFHSLLHPH
jgi:hypothetical protein